jgi:hypothetical protein
LGNGIFTPGEKFTKLLKKNPVMKSRYIITVLLLGFSASSMAQMTAYANIYAQVVTTVGVQWSNNQPSGYEGNIASKDLKAIREAEVIHANHRIISDDNHDIVASFLVATNNQTFELSLPSEKLYFNNAQGNKVELSITSNTSSLKSRPGSRVFEIVAVMNRSEKIDPADYVVTDPLRVTLNYN